MERLTNEEFGSWAAGLGLASHGRRNPMPVGYLSGRGALRSWEIPESSRHCLELTNWAIAGLAPWSSCVLWTIAGEWGRDVWLPGGCRDSTTWDLIHRWAGIEDGWEGAIRLGREQENIIKALAFTFAAFGSSSQDDLFLIPDHGLQFIHLDPWNSDIPNRDGLMLSALKVHFSEEDLAKQFVGHMSRASFVPTWPAQESAEGTA